jgi:phosphatidylglycerophosphate synthase
MVFYMLTTRHKPALNHWLEPLARYLSRLGVSPFALTLAAPVLTLVVCVLFVNTRAVVPFCLAMAVVGALDGLDGAVARASGRVTKLGAYVDAMADRYVEIMVIVSAGIVTGYWALLLLVLAGSLLVSYAKARAAMEVPVSNLEWPDLMERAERSAVFLVGLMAGALVPWRPGGHDLFWWALWLLIILVYATVIQRTWRALRLIQARSR